MPVPHLTLSADGTSLDLSTIDGGAPIAALTAEEVEQLAASLWERRSSMLPALAVEPHADLQYRINPPWRTFPGSDPQFALLALQTLHREWQGFAFPLPEARNLGGWLLTYVRDRHRFETIAEKLASLPSQASSISGPDFLITSHGGAFFYGIGERAIGPDPFEQVEYDSDRAVGIVAAAIVERCLEFAIEGHRGDGEESAYDLAKLRFSEKIKVAKKSGLLSDEAVKELKIISNIRNIFSHELSVDSFKAKAVRSACSKLTVIDRVVGPILSKEDVDTGNVPSEYEGVENFEEKIRDPRFRYWKTAQILGFKLGASSRSSPSHSPFI